MARVFHSTLSRGHSSALQASHSGNATVDIASAVGVEVPVAAKSGKLPLCWHLKGEQDLFGSQRGEET